jgi:hypothetical protein
MADPHNPQRYGETWDPHKLAVMEAEVRLLACLGVISGGWAWHFMAPKGHPEYKHGHDHKDIDLMVPQADGAIVFHDLRDLGYQHVRTTYDTPDSSFFRYEKTVEEAGKPPVKVQVDVFIETVPYIDIPEAGVRVVEPKYLLSLYGVKHSSESCWAVLAARKLLAQGISPVGRPELAEMP